MPIRKKPRKRSQRRTPSPPSLLVVQCDIQKLATDGLTLDGPVRFASIVSYFGLGATTKVVEVRTERHLCDQLGKLAEAGLTFDVIVLIGHSSPHGMKLSSDPARSWEAVARFLRPFRPRRLLLVACKGGRFDGINVLFRELPKLRRIYASPVNVTKQLAEILTILVPHILLHKQPTKDTVRTFQFFGLVAAKTPVWEWTRTRDFNNPQGRLYDLLGDLVGEAVGRAFTPAGHAAFPASSQPPSPSSAAAPAPRRARPRSCT